MPVIGVGMRVCPGLIYYGFLLQKTGLFLSLRD
jgi:hypothetical protein